MRIHTHTHTHRTCAQPLVLWSGKGGLYNPIYRACALEGVQCAVKLPSTVPLALDIYFHAQPRIRYPVVPSFCITLLCRYAIDSLYYCEPTYYICTPPMLSCPFVVVFSDAGQILGTKANTIAQRGGHTCPSCYQLLFDSWGPINENALADHQSFSQLHHRSFGHVRCCRSHSLGFLTMLPCSVLFLRSSSDRHLASARIIMDWTLIAILIFQIVSDSSQIMAMRTGTFVSSVPSSFCGQPLLGLHKRKPPTLHMHAFTYVAHFLHARRI